MLLLKDSSIIAITVAPGNIFKGVIVKRRAEEKRVVRENSHLLIRLKVLPDLVWWLKKRAQVSSERRGLMFWVSLFRVVGAWES